MKRRFKIINEKKNELRGYLYYDTEKDKYSMKILDSYKGQEPEIFFYVLNQRGITNVPQHLVDMWVRGRVITPNRQGLQGILKNCGMSEYNVFDLLIYAHGRCHNDDLCIEEIDNNN